MALFIKFSCALVNNSLNLTVSNPEVIPLAETGAKFVNKSTGVFTDKDEAAALLKVYLDPCF